MRTDGLIRRVIPFSLPPLAVLATALSSAMWLRAFPAATLAVPLFGAALLSVGLTMALVLLLRRSMLVTVPAGLLGFGLYALLVVLRDPLGFGSLAAGFVHGPAQLLSFALPLVSPSSLLVWPVALCWLAGLLAGESLARSRLSLLPYATWLVVFGVGYAGGSRAMGPDAATARRIDLAVGGALLLVLVLLRVAQGWLAQDAAAEAAGRVSDGTNVDATELNLLPLQRIGAGLGTAAVVVLVAGYLASSSVFAGAPTELKRNPAVQQADPTTPMAFVASLRPASRTDPGTPLFSVNLDRPVPGYFGLASVDFYDGDSWSFDRNFAPSGGVVPADEDPQLQPAGPPVEQGYRITSPLLTAGPWLPSVYRPQRVTGVAISVDPGSGMVVPTGQLSVGSGYRVSSTRARQVLTDLATGWLPATSTAPVNSQLPGQLRGTLAGVVTGFATETGQSSADPAGFLTALVGDLHTNYLLTDPAAASASTPPASTAAKARPSKSRAGKAKPSKSAKPTVSATPRPTVSAGSATGGSSLSAVLAAILGPQRSGTPEQYATLVALVARDLGVPARIVSGFRLTAPDGSHTAAPGNHVLGTRDAYSWVEVPVRGQGWVVLDPAPSRYATTEAQPSVGVTKSSTPSRSPSQAALVTQSDGGHAVAPRSDVHTAVRHSGGWPWPLLLAGLALLVLVLAGLLAGRRQLRLVRRRRLAEPRRRVIGAWAETLDLLAEAGLGELTALTGAEIGRAAAERFGPEPAAQVRRVAAAADRAAFSEQAVIIAPEADAAWAAHAELRRLVRAALPVSDRLLVPFRYSSASRGRPVRNGLLPRRRGRFTTSRPGAGHRPR